MTDYTPHPVPIAPEGQPTQSAARVRPDDQRESRGEARDARDAEIVRLERELATVTRERDEARGVIVGIDGYATNAAETVTEYAWAFDGILEMTRTAMNAWPAANA